MAWHYPFIIIHGTIRVIIFFSAIITTAYSYSGHQIVNISGYNLEASFKGSPAFKVLYVMSWVVIASSPFIMLYLYIGRPKSLSEDISSDKATTCFVLVLYDIIMMSAMISAWASAGATYYTCYNGNIHLGWIPICDLVNNYCKKRFTTIVSSSITIFGFMVASIYSAYMLTTLSSPTSSPSPPPSSRPPPPVASSSG